MSDVSKHDALIEYLENIQNLTDFKFTDLFTKILGDGDYSNIVPPCQQSLGYLLVQGAYDQVAIQLVRSHYPDARYGFDFNPSVKPDKIGKDKKANAWVRYGVVDISVSHKFPCVALTLALVSVKRQIIILTEYKERSQLSQ